MTAKQKSPVGNAEITALPTGQLLCSKSVHSTLYTHLPKIMMTIYNHTFRVNYYKNYPEVNTMKGRILTDKQIAALPFISKAKKRAKIP